MQTPVSMLAALFGGKSKLAEAAGVDPAMVTRWEKPSTWKQGRHVGNDGHVPPRHNHSIVVAAVAHARTLPNAEGQTFVEAVRARLDPSVCPTCGQQVDDGRVL